MKFPNQAKLMKDFRSNLGVTQLDLGRYCIDKNASARVAGQTISEIERGNRGIPASWIPKLRKRGLDLQALAEAIGADKIAGWEK